MKKYKEKAVGNAKVSAGARLMVQLVLAGLFSIVGAVILLSTLLFIYTPIKQANKTLTTQRLESRMELSLLIADVFPSMKVDDELGDVVLRALENKKDTLRNESAAIVKEIEALQSTDANAADLIRDTGYDTVNWTQIVNDAATSQRCFNALNRTVQVLDEKIEVLGVAKLKQEIATLKGTTTTVTREDENGNTYTETVVSGGLVPTEQAKKDALQKKCDDLQAKYDALAEYLDDNNGRITEMYNRLESEQKAYDVYSKMEAISEYAKKYPKDNMFLQDVTAKLDSFPGESKEEDDILFIMKVESETGIRMQTVNYGQDYQHKQLSNGMLLCYEVYSIPYYSGYQGLKNLISYFNENDDFYASIYTLTIQYNAVNESIQGNMVILHYYLLDENAEYVPPVIGEQIIPGVDGIFGEVTDNGKTHGKQSAYTVADIKSWLDDGMTFEGIRDKLKSEGYPATEFAWIMKEEYKTPTDMQAFLEEYGEEGVEYDLDYVLDLLECDLAELMEIYYAVDPDDNTGNNSPEKPDDGSDSEDTSEQPEETTDDQDDTSDQPEDPTENDGSGSSEGTAGSGDDTPDAPEDTEEENGTTEAPVEDPTEEDSVPEESEDTTESDKISQNPLAGKQSTYTADDIEAWLNGGMTLEQSRDRLVDEGYPASELAWILSEKYDSELEIVAFMMRHGEMDEYKSLSDATDLFGCSLSDLKKIYNS